MITTFYPPYNFGGDGIHVHQLTNELARRGHHVEVIHCQDSYRFLAGRAPEAARNDHPKVTVHGLKSPLGFLSPLATHQTGLPIFKSNQIKRILSNRFDVIHYHNISLVGGCGILKYGQAVKLYTTHEFWLFCPASTMVKYNRAPCTNPNCFLCSLAHKRPPQLWRKLGLIPKAARHIDAFIHPSSYARQFYRNQGFTTRSELIPYFTPDAPLEPWPLNHSKPVPYFLFAGRLEKLKGLQDIIPLFQNHPAAELWVAGDGGYETRLRKLAAGNPRIRFLGRLSHQQLQPLYRNAVALIVPSRWTEIFGLVIIEAFRQQTPVLVKNTGGMPEIINKSGGGFIYSSDRELKNLMDELLADPDKRRETGLRGYEACKREWTADTFLLRYLRLIDEIRAGSS